MLSMIYGAIKPNMFRSRSRCIDVFTEKYRPFEFKFFLFIFRQDSKYTGGVDAGISACVSIFVLICVYCYECCSSPLYCVNVSNDSLVLLQM